MWIIINIERDVGTSDVIQDSEPEIISCVGSSLSTSHTRMMPTSPEVI